MLAPWKKNYDKTRQHIKKQRHYFTNTGLSSQSYGISSSHVWMWELDYKESWVPKNWCFWTVVLEKTLEGRNARRSNQSNVKEINPEYSLEGHHLPMSFHCSWSSNTLATWCEELTHWKKTMVLGKIEGRRRRGWQRMRCLDGITDSWIGVLVNSGSWWWTGRPGVLQSMVSQRAKHTIKWFTD